MSSATTVGADDFFSGYFEMIRQRSGINFPLDSYPDVAEYQVMKIHFQVIIMTQRSLLVFGFLFVWIASSWHVASANPIRPVRPMPHGRAFHGACVLGNHLYVIGGVSYAGKDFNTIVKASELDTLMAPILPNGDLGEWRITTPLPSPRHYINSATVVLNDVVYIVGGTDDAGDGNRHTTILMNRAGADGSLGDWEETARFPNSGLSFTSLFSTPGWLHMVGGITSERAISSKLWSVEVKPDGRLGRWREGPPLPTPLWFHQSAVTGGRVYVFGGLETYPHSKKLGANVFSAPLLGDGSIGQWERSAPLPKPFYGGVASSIGPYIMSFMGRYSGAPQGLSTDVWWTVASPEGLMDWKQTKTEVGISFYHAVAPNYRNSTFYVAGGRRTGSTTGGTPMVFLFSLTPAARAYAERGWSGGADNNDSDASLESLSLATGATPGRNGQNAALKDLPPYFVPYQLARLYDDMGRMRPVVMYFTAAEAKPAREQNAKLAEAGLEAAASRVTFATVDVVATPQVAQQRGVFRVPTWLFFDSRGNLVERRTGQMNPTELLERVNALR